MEKLRKSRKAGIQMEGLIFPMFLRELNMISIVFRFLLCIFCGGIIGIEREKMHRAAGFRTHILVCTGATMAMLTGQYIFEYLSASADPARLGAQVISGIGFLGVGTIIVTKNSKVKGLTTAAGLWVAACIGIAIGIGFYEVALVGTMIAQIVIVIMFRIDKAFFPKAHTFDIYIEVQKVSSVKEIIGLIKDNDYHIVSMEMKKSKLQSEEYVGVMFRLQKEEEEEQSDIIRVLSECKEVVYFQEIEEENKG